MKVGEREMEADKKPPQERTNKLTSVKTFLKISFSSCEYETKKSSSINIMLKAVVDERPIVDPREILFSSFERRKRNLKFLILVLRRKGEI